MIRRSLLLFALFGSAASAQDMFAVSWSGTAYQLDSYTASATPIGTSLCCSNGLDIAGGVVWSTHRSGNPWIYHMTAVDPGTGTAAIVFSNVPDVRAMASDGSVIWCVQDGGDVLSIFDPGAGSFTTIGPLNYSAVQALAWHQGSLYAADNVHGLLLVDPLTGAATDLDPVGIPNGTWQFLASRADGKLIAGNNLIWEVDPADGSATLIGNAGSIDLRGAVEVFGNAQPFGTGCNGTFGPVALTANGSISAGGTLDLVSSNHAAGTNGALIFGLSRLAVPIDLDPLFGTAGCSLHPSPELFVGGVTLGPEPANLFFSLPLGIDNGGFVLHMQHVAIESAVPGSLSASNGLTVHIGY